MYWSNCYRDIFRFSHIYGHSSYKQQPVMMRVKITEHITNTYHRSHLKILLHTSGGKTNHIRYIAPTITFFTNSPLSSQSTLISQLYNTLHTIHCSISQVQYIVVSPKVFDKILTSLYKIRSKLI